MLSMLVDLWPSHLQAGTDVAEPPATACSDVHVKVGVQVETVTQEKRRDLDKENVPPEVRNCVYAL